MTFAQKPAGSVSPPLPGSHAGDGAAWPRTLVAPASRHAETAIKLATRYITNRSFRTRRARTCGHDQHDMPEPPAGMSRWDRMQRICVFCGSSPGGDPAYFDAAQEMGREIVARNLTLVYGGGHVGLMGAIADAVLDAGGSVIGVIPHALAVREVAHQRLTRLHVVGSMHERKAMMADLSDAFVALPGGFGTLRGVLRGGHLDAARRAQEALRVAERGRLLRSAGPVSRQRGVRAVRPPAAPSRPSSWTRILAGSSINWAACNCRTCRSGLAWRRLKTGRRQPATGRRKGKRQKRQKAKPADGRRQTRRQ